MIVVAIFYGLGAILAFVGNLLVLLVIITNQQFRNMRYFLLASLALSDFLFAVTVTSNRTIATALEEWIFGTPWCHGAAYLIRVLHLSTVFHLCAVTLERYDAIVREPLRYTGHITRKKILANITLLWIVPAIISLGPFFGWGDYVYNPDIFACEQKWDKQTTFPLAIASFLLPLGVILGHNYKVLKVVSQLQRSANIIGFQPNEIPDEMEDHQNQQKRDNPIQDASFSKHNQQQQNEDVKALEMVIVKPRTADKSSGIQCHENAVYPEEPNAAHEENRREDFVGQVRNAKSAQDKSLSLVKGSKGWSSAKENGASISKNRTNAMDNGYSKPKRCLDRKEKQSTRPEPRGRYQPNILAKMELQIEVMEDKLPCHHGQNRTIKDVNGSDMRGSRQAYTQETYGGKKIGVIPQSSCEIDMEIVIRSQDGGKPRLQTQTQNPRGKEKVTPENEIQSVEQVETEANQEHKSQLKEQVLKCGNFEPEENHEREKRPPGKTQMRVGMLLKEGKAARDVMIIISAFLVCYLPLWIMAVYRCTGKVLPAEAIIATHCVYCYSMAWNPIIYSVRKKEFRKALKKLLKL